MPQLPRITSVILLLLAAVNAEAQIANVPPASVDPSAEFQINATSKGVLFPRMNAVQRLSISAPANGLLVYDNDSFAFMVYAGSGWTRIMSTDSDQIWKRRGTDLIAAGTAYNSRFGFNTSAPKAKFSYMDSSYTTGNYPSILLEKDYPWTANPGGSATAMKITTSESGSRGSGTYTALSLSGVADGLSVTTPGKGITVNSSGVGLFLNATGSQPALQVNGTTQLYGSIAVLDGTEGVNKVLTSDANGNASWQLSSAGVWLNNGSNIYNNNTGAVSIGTQRTGGAKVFIQDSLGVAGYGKTTLLVRSYNAGGAAISAQDSFLAGPGIGVSGASAQGSGVQGFSDAGVGVTGLSNSGIGGYFTSSTGPALITGFGKSVGFGTTSPTEVLDIDGRLRLRNNTSSTAAADGTIRYTTANGFEGRTGGNWTPLGGAAGSSPWAVSANNISNTNSGSVSINTNKVRPARLFVDDSLHNGEAALYVRSFNNAGAAVAAFDSSRGSGGTALLARSAIGFGVLANSTSGCGVYGMSDSGIGGYFSSSNGQAALLALGKVGINTPNPVTGLHVANGSNVLFGTDTTTGTGGFYYNSEQQSLRVGPLTSTTAWMVTNMGQGSFGAGLNNFVKGGNAAAIGEYNFVSANNSLAVGDGDSVFDQYAVALGRVNRARQVGSLATGFSTLADGFYSISAGENTIATNLDMAVFGAYNDTTGAGGGQIWNGSDHLFVIGNGTGTGQTPRTNALVMLKNGRAGFGVNMPLARLDVAGPIRVSNSTGYGDFAGMMRYNGSAFEGYDGSSWKAFSTSGPQTLSVSGSTLSISGGNSVTLPSGGGGGFFSAANIDDITNSNTGRVLIGSQIGTPSSQRGRLTVRDTIATGTGIRVWETASYGSAIVAHDSAASGNPRGCTNCTGQEAINAFSTYGDALFARTKSGRGIYLKGGSNFYPAMVVDTNGGAISALQLNGPLQLNYGSPASGKVLTSDANGFGSWQTAQTGPTYTPGSGITISGSNVISAADNSATNELQTLSISGSILSISNGNSVTLPSGGSGGSQWFNLTNGVRNNNGNQVGINTSSPLSGFALDVRDSAGTGSIANFETSASTGTLSFGANATPVGYIGTSYNGNFDFGTPYASAGKIRLLAQSQYGLTISPTGDVGIGIQSPRENLELSGGILIGNSSNTNAGTLRFNGTGFEGYNGFGWDNFKSFWNLASNDISANNTGSVLIGATFNSANSPKLDVEQTNGAGGGASFYNLNPANSTDAVFIGNLGTGNGLHIASHPGNGNAVLKLENFSAPGAGLVIDNGSASTYNALTVAHAASASAVSVSSTAPTANEPAMQIHAAGTGGGLSVSTSSFSTAAPTIYAGNSGAGASAFFYGGSGVNIATVSSSTTPQLMLHDTTSNGAARIFFKNNAGVGWQLEGTKGASQSADEIKFINTTGVQDVLTLKGDGRMGVNVAAPHSTVQSGGSFAAAISTKTASYTADAGDYTIIMDASSTALTLSLPSASGIAGRIYTIKKKDNSSNSVTISPSGSETIDGAASQSLSAQWKYITLQSDGSAWMIIANN